jgi:hypothetical protein
MSVVMTEQLGTELLRIVYLTLIVLLPCVPPLAKFLIRDMGKGGESKRTCERGAGLDRFETALQYVRTVSRRPHIKRVDDAAVQDWRHDTAGSIAHSEPHAIPYPICRVDI